MKFERIQMNGFGMYRDKTIELDTQAPAVLFLGRNEAGKSTLMGFIRVMLFGFPTRANMAQRYEPQHGGLHGGALTLRGSLGEPIRVERFEKNRELKLIYEDGTLAGEAALHSLLGGLTEDVYRNLFAFSLTELQRLESLRSEQISGFLYSSGMGVSGSAIVQTERKLAAGMEQLYKPRGTRQTLNTALKEIEAGETELRRSIALSGQYSVWQAEAAALDSQISEQERMLVELREQRDWLNKCRQARPIWLKQLEVERELAQLGNWQPVPEAAVVRLEQLNTEQSTLLERLDLLTLKREKLNQRIAETIGDRRSRGVAADNTDLRAGTRIGFRIGRGGIASLLALMLSLCVWLWLWLGYEASPGTLLGAGLFIGLGAVVILLWLRWQKTIHKERQASNRQLEAERQRQWDEAELELIAEQEVVQQSLRRLDSKRQELFQDAEVADESQLRQAQRHYAQAMELLREQRQVEVHLAAWVKEDQLSRLQDTLSTVDASQLEIHAHEAERKISEAEQGLNVLRDERGRLRGELERLQAGTAHAAQLQMQQERISEFEQSAHDWMRLALAAELIRQSRAIYERDRQPGVLRQASVYFAAITRGRYTRVISRLGEKLIYVERPNGEQIESGLLSRGTAEQLYLSMRFALADEYAKTVTLPIVMDDIFVNFDRERLRDTMMVLREVASRRQILLFTCHEHVAKAVREAMPGTQEITLHA